MTVTSQQHNVLSTLLQLFDRLSGSIFYFVTNGYNRQQCISLAKINQTLATLLIILHHPFQQVGNSRSKIFQ